MATVRQVCREEPANLVGLWFGDMGRKNGNKQEKHSKEPPWLKLVRYGALQ
jgi:hypothetical protein